LLGEKTEDCYDTHIYDHDAPVGLWLAGWDILRSQNHLSAGVMPFITDLDAEDHEEFITYSRALTSHSTYVVEDMRISLCLVLVFRYVDIKEAHPTCELITNKGSSYEAWYSWLYATFGRSKKQRYFHIT
jgi:hypothetical protein